MAIANYKKEKPLIIYTFKKLCNGEQRLTAQQPHHKSTKFSNSNVKTINAGTLYRCIQTCVYKKIIFMK